MNQLKLNAWVGLVVFALVAPPAFADEEVAAAEEEATEVEQSPLNLRACAALLALTPGEWVIVDDKELRRVPGWAEELDEDESEFTGLPECARRIGVPPASSPAAPAETEQIPRAAAPRAPVHRPKETLHPLEVRPHEQGTWKEPFSWYLPTPRLVASAPTIDPTEETPPEPVDEPAIVAKPFPERALPDYVEGWNLLAGLNHSYDTPRPEFVFAPPSTASGGAFNVLGNLFGNLPVVDPETVTSLTPRLDEPGPARVPVSEIEFNGLTPEQLAAIQRRSRSVLARGPKVPLVLSGGASDVAATEPVVFTRSSDGALEEAPGGPAPSSVALPEPTGLALVGLGLLSAIAVRVRR